MTEDLHDRLATDVSALARKTERTVAVAESLTGGMVAAALARAEGSSDWFRGGIVAYSSEVKHELLQVPDGPVVSEPAARAMAQGVRRLLGADVAVATTGAGGPAPQDGAEPGTVYIGVDDGASVTVVRLELDGEPGEVCGTAAEEALRALAAVLDDAPDR